ncbi:MAG: pentapeptide repeat-containing protein [Solimicrobium sp.]|nr:pentapeptide repeat-containing protein [Solimicrobium sp.]
MLVNSYRGLVSYECFGFKPGGHFLNESLTTSIKNMFLANVRICDSNSSEQFSAIMSRVIPVIEKVNSSGVLDLHGDFIERLDLEPLDLNGDNLSKADLSHAYLSDAKLVRANLIHANLYSAFMARTDLSMADLRWANLSVADFSGARLARADLRGADLSMAEFAGAELDAADLSGANLTDANLSGTNLEAGVKLLGAVSTDRAILRLIKEQTFEIYRLLPQIVEGVHFEKTDFPPELIKKIGQYFF